MISGRDVLRECTLRGLVLRADAMRFIEHSALLSSPTDIVVLMDAIVVRLDNKIERVVDKAVVIAALDTLSSPQSSSTIRSLDAWSTPRLVYDAANKTYSNQEDKCPCNVLGSPLSTMALLQDRWHNGQRRSTLIP
mmetsp:Transcript_20776/g.68638  ORF Transcript_20776/g.68638 Transcript_20776/m.68638 type:complete len:136 (-) Transcript_20776:1979-2386(-)